MKPSNLLLVMLAVASSPLLAQSSGEAGAGQVAADPVVAIETRTENGFTYACGGVGETEEAQMKERARDYDMMLTFATRKGEYLADVNVAIEDARGDTQLQTMCGGPIMLVDVPKSGTYRIHAESGGYTLNKTARVTTRQRHPDALVMHWPSPIGESLEATPTGSSGAPSASQSGAADADAPPNPDMPRSEPPVEPPADPAVVTPPQ